jgi:conjugal transfer pilus assembly protein TraE
MKFSFQQKKLGNLQVQRNMLLGLSGILLSVVFLQTTLLFFKNQRIVFMPPELKQSFWVEGNSFSPIYLEEQGLYFTHLLLDVSEGNILAQGDILLRYVDPKVYGAFRTKLLEDEKRLKKDSLSLKFAPVSCEVFPENLKVHITGDLVGYVGHKKITTHRETYEVVFSSYKSQLFLKEFTVLRTDGKEVENATD